MEGLWGYFAEKVGLLLERANKDLGPCDVHMGLRTIAQQDGLYALGRDVANPDGKTKLKPLGNTVTNAKGGYSWHNYGLAVDVVWKPEGKWSWAETMPWTKLGMMGMELGLEWGGNWSKFPDRPHFQISRGLTVQDALLLHQEGGIEAVWNAIAKKLALEK